MIIVDAHEDLAWNMLTFGRDYTKSVEETRARESGTPVVSLNGHTLLGWPEWVKGRVAVVFTTLFAKPNRWRKGSWDRLCYSDSAQAYRLYRQQLDLYHRLAEEEGEKFRLLFTLADLDQVLESWQGEAPKPMLGLVLLMEGAECLRQVEELEAWVEEGVRILGPAWGGTRFSGGTREPGPLTKEGRALLDLMADLGLILDLSHMTDEAFFEALDRYEGMVIASHSNARALLEGVERPERHLSDTAIDRLAERDGVMGVIPYNLFLLGGWQPSQGRDLVGIDHVVAQIDHICQRLGTSRHVAIGSDFDGGFGLDKAPQGLDSIADLGLIGEALLVRGYGQDDAEAILGGNWLRILRRGLPGD